MQHPERYYVFSSLENFFINEHDDGGSSCFEPPSSSSFMKKSLTKFYFEIN